MFQDPDTDQWIQIASDAGGVRGCGDEDFPSYFVRLNDPSVFNFITHTIRYSTDSLNTSELMGNSDNETTTEFFDEEY